MVPIKDLSTHPYSQILGYPNPTKKILRDRISELKSLGVSSIQFKGHVEIYGLKILGKGCVSIVVIANTRKGEAALKIRRIDANRPNMEREVKFLTKANTVGVGPKILRYSNNFLLIDLITGQLLPKWIKTLSGKGSSALLRKICLDILEKCRKLDKIGLDHGELSNMSKHVFVNGDVEIIDFESASERTVKNITSAVQYLFIGGYYAKKINKMLSIKNKDKIITAIQYYKKNKTQESYLNLLNELKLIKNKK